MSLHIMINDEDFSHSFSPPFLLLNWHCCLQRTRLHRIADVGQKMTVSKIKMKQINKRTTSHFLVLVGGKSHCYTFCFSVEGSCASAHTLACELVVPVKWVRVPQEGRFMYFRAMCQHLLKKVQCTVLACLTHVCTHTHSFSPKRSPS